MDFKTQWNVYMQSSNNHIKSYAKINLGLKVLNTLSDGYHSIWTIMHEIDLYDTISIKKVVITTILVLGFPIGI